MIRKVFIFLLNGAGINDALGHELTRVIITFKRRLVGVVIFSLVAPFMEVAFIGTLYVLLSIEKQETVLQYLHTFRICEVLPVLCRENSFNYVISGLAALFLVLRMATNLGLGYILSRLNYVTYVNFAHRLIASYLNAPPSAVMRLDRNKVAQAVNVEAASFGDTAVHLLTLMTNITGALFMLVTAGLLSPWLLCAACGVGMFIFCINRRAYWKSRSIGEKRVQEQASLLGKTIDILSSYRVIVLEGSEDSVLHRLDSFLWKNQLWRFEKTWNEYIITHTAQGIIYFTLLLVIFIASVLLNLDLALLMTFMIVMSRLQSLVLLAQGRWMKIKRAIPPMELVYKLLNQESRESQRQIALAAQSSMRLNSFSIRFENVSFRYPNGKDVLRNVSLNMKPGDRVLIQGRSGGGKSTFMLTLAGMLTPTKGKILFNGQLFDETLFFNVRAQLAYAAPDLHVLRDSIRENLLLAGDFTEAELLSAIHKARLESLVEKTAGGLDGFIGENGSMLSLGERQRVMLARTFLRKPKLVLLDEATGNLNVELEESILSDLFLQLEPEAIVVVIAHKQPWSVDFNRIFSMHDGKLEEVEKYEDLATKK